MKKMMNAASIVLKRAVELDINNKNTESLVCYQEGIDLLMKATKEDELLERRQYLNQKIDEYLKRATEVKKRIHLLKEQGKYHEQIEIGDNSIGHSYGKVFSRFLDEEIAEIMIEDPYIRAFHQCQNLVRFFELAITKCAKLKRIVLQTTREANSQQASWFGQIGDDLHKRGIRLDVVYNGTLHDRKITLSTGWIIKIGRGLDYFKAPDFNLAVGAFDMDLRRCHQTTIDIFHSNNVRQL